MLEDSNVRKGRGQEKRMESPGDLRLQGRGDRLAQGLEVRRMRSEKLPDGARVPLQRLALAERAGPKFGDRAGAAGQGNGSMVERALIPALGIALGAPQAQRGAVPRIGSKDEAGGAAGDPRQECLVRSHVPGPGSNEVREAVERGRQTHGG